MANEKLEEKQVSVDIFNLVQDSKFFKLIVMFWTE